MALAILPSFLCRRVAGLAIHMIPISNTILPKCLSIVKHNREAGAGFLPPRVSCYRLKSGQVSLGFLPDRTRFFGMRTGFRPNPRRSFSIGVFLERLDRLTNGWLNAGVGPQAANISRNELFAALTALQSGRFQFLHSNRHLLCAGIESFPESKGGDLNCELLDLVVTAQPFSIFQPRYTAYTG